MSVTMDYEDKLWEDFNVVVLQLAEKTASVAPQIRKSVSTYFAVADVGFYWNPDIEKVGMYFRPEVHTEDFKNYSIILTEKVGEDKFYPQPLSLDNLESEWWVKVAYSPTLRRLGETLQFFPSKDGTGFGGRPLASMLASGLVGAGLGYGTGYIGEKIMPDWMQEEGRTRKSMATLGGLAGLGLGSTPGLINLATGRSFNDPTLMSGDPSEGFKKASNSVISETYYNAVEDYLEKTGSFGATIGGPGFDQEPVIRTNTLGRVLWNNEVNPQLTAMTMGAVYGANQMQDQNASPGRVTPHQMGMFGMAMGAAGGGVKGYVTGRLVGRGLGMLTGMPEATQDTLASSSMVAGVVGNLVPKLFQ